MPDRRFVLLLTLMGVLLVVWPIPGTIALRNALLTILVLTLVFTREASGACWPRWPLLLITTLTLWMAIVISGWAVEPALSWKEYWAQWILPLICGSTGAAIALRALNRGLDSVRLLIGTVFYCFFGLVLLHNLMDATYWAITGVMPFRQAPVLYIPELLERAQNSESLLTVFNGQHGEKFSFVNNTLAAMLFAEIIQRLMQRKRWIPVSNALLGIGLAALLLCSYWLSFRNGNIGLLGMLIMAGVMVLIRMRHQISLKRISVAFVLGVAIVVGLTTAFWKSDARWARFVETLPIALDTEHHKAWISTKLEPYPLLSDGQPVDASAYERISWIKEGAKLALEQPLGTGHNRTAFFDGIDRKFNLGGLVRGGHAHSGVVDFAIANGIPGILLWVGFLASVAWVGWKAFRSGNTAAGLILMFLVSGFMSRSFVDSNLRDHVLQQFLFMVGLFTLIASNLDCSET